MDCLALVGEKPIIPAPPKVCPVRPVPEVVEVVDPKIELLLEAALVALPLADPVLAEAELSLELLAAPVAEVESLAEEPEFMNELPMAEAPAMVFPPLDPIPASVDPTIGCPKNPITVGTLFWPN